MTPQITTQPKVELVGADTDELEAIVKEAAQDPYLRDDDGNVPFDQHRTAILLDGAVVGFLSPYIFTMSGERYWRAGPLYLTPSVRGKGFMREVLLAFFDTHYPGLTWIDDTNKASIKLYVSLGFTRHSPWPAANGGQGHWYTQTESSSPRAVLEHWKDLMPAYLRW